jgi:hypothetical protein
VRILVTGSRDWPYREIVWRELDLAVSDRFLRETITVVEGQSPGGGADDHVHEWVLMMQRKGFDVRSERHPPDRRRHGWPMAAFIRNQEMVDAGADLCLAFRLNGSAGTTDCLARIRKAGLPRKIIDLAVREEGVND